MVPGSQSHLCVSVISESAAVASYDGVPFVFSSFSLTAISSTSLFGTNDRLLTSITLEGIESGARVTIPVEISKDVIAVTATQAQTGVTLR